MHHTLRCVSGTYWLIVAAAAADLHHPLLGAIHRTAYTAAGYDPEELLNPVLAKAEGRHSAIFCELSHDGHATGTESCVVKMTGP